MLWDDSAYAPIGASADRPNKRPVRRGWRKPAKVETPDTKFPGDHRSRVTPVPIPNTEVKPATADGTARAGGWESRSLPGINTKGPSAKHSGLFFVQSPSPKCPTRAEAIRGPRQYGMTGREDLVLRAQQRSDLICDLLVRREPHVGLCLDVLHQPLEHRRT